MANITFEFDSGNGLLRCRVDGVVSDEEMRELYKSIGRYVAQTQPRSGIVDLSGVTSFRVSVETMRGLAALPPPMPDPKQPRFIVAASDHVFGMSRLFEAEGEKTRPMMRVVRTIDEAYAMLGIREPRFEPVN